MASTSARDIAKSAEDLRRFAQSVEKEGISFGNYKTELTKYQRIMIEIIQLLEDLANDVASRETPPSATPPTT